MAENVNNERIVFFISNGFIFALAPNVVNKCGPGEEKELMYRNKNFTGELG